MAEIQLTHIVAGVAIYKDGQFLLVQESNPKCFGQWNWPAGKVDAGNTIEQTAVIEAQEEVGLTVSLNEKIDIFQQESNPYVPMHLFSATILSGTLTPARNELLDAKYFSIEEIRTLDLRDPWVIAGAEMTLNK